jgi:hypothetical protein
MTNIILDIVADYSISTSDLAFSEVRNRFFSYFNNPLISMHGVSPFNTIENAFFVGQLGLNSKLGNHHVIFHNVAPRKDDLAARVNNAGEKLGFCILPNGVLVVGVLSGYSFSFLNEVVDVYVSKCDFAGSQFRSRDVFPQYVATIYNAVKNGNKDSIIESTIEKGALPKVPKNRIVYIDGYGNLKTTIEITPDVVLKKEIKLEINGVQKLVKIGLDGVFSAKDGDLVLSKGSSGWNFEDTNRVFYEVFLRGGSACKAFNNAQVGDGVVLL